MEMQAGCPAAPSFRRHPSAIQARPVWRAKCARWRQVVVGTAGGRVALVDNCAAGDCAIRVLADGFQSVEGLAWVGADTLLILDGAGNAIYEMVADFCAL